MIVTARNNAVTATSRIAAKRMVMSRRSGAARTKTALANAAAGHAASHRRFFLPGPGG